MTPRGDSEARDECALLVARMRPRLVAARIGEYVRGGLPGASLRDGGRSADPPLPHLDRTDHDQLERLAAYHAHLGRYAQAIGAHNWRAALGHLEKAFEVETGIIPEEHLTPEQLAEQHKRMSRAAVLEVSTRAVDCVNPNCRRPIECTPDDRPRAGRCFNCWRYWKAHGHTERPAELCEVEHAQSA